MLLIQFILAISVMLLSFALGYEMTEGGWQLTRLSPMFDMKPFTCRLCLSTHITWIAETCLALLFASWPLFAFGIACAAAVYYAIWHDTKEKTIIIG